jgi:hypothetical protein
VANVSVKNIMGTSHAKCDCSNWLKHWEKFSGRKANYCAAYGCMSSPETGAHVRTAQSQQWYIVPLCHVHSHLDQFFVLSEGAVLVSANINTTCGEKLGFFKKILQRFFKEE